MRRHRRRMGWNRRSMGHSVHVLKTAYGELSCYKHPYGGWAWGMYTYRDGTKSTGRAADFAGAKAAAVAALRAWALERNEWPMVDIDGNIYELETRYAILTCLFDEDGDWRWYMLSLTSGPDRSGTALYLNDAKAAALDALRALVEADRVAVGGGE